MSSKALQVLDLSYNKIENTVFLQHLSSLEMLDLSYNCIKVLEAPPMANL